MWKLKQMMQINVIRFARCRELGLLRIINYLYMLTCIRHRNQSLEQYYKNLACGYLPPPGVLKLLKTPFILLESDDRLFAYRVYNRRIRSCCKHI